MQDAALSLRARRVVPQEQQTTRVSGQNGFPEKAVLPPLCVQFPKANKPNHFEATASRALPENRGQLAR